ncbi:XRE family transcriptional regulator [Pseudoflavonifractor sp. 524-17]|uniref:XRE family transcriptional regulator n=1 Tax=Pseudoflavonifractor sp. 524-17 TaxID=2304577 RepID=UPI00137A0DAC|nr:XRE family transcriptional regulator [Pseudoflavonifractor sp. 524-17]NCE64687.1 XRE family transcriptional regulator [Pseudoflavonifractor sp. 524-17]
MRDGRKTVLRQIEQMAKSRPNDVVKLAFLDGGQLEEIDRMDLMMLSELRRSGNGGVEVKLNDRLKTLERLLELSRESEEAGGFFQALEKAAEGLNEI